MTTFVYSEIVITVCQLKMLNEGTYIPFSKKSEIIQKMYFRIFLMLYEHLLGMTQPQPKPDMGFIYIPILGIRLILSEIDKFIYSRRETKKFF